MSSLHPQLLEALQPLRQELSQAIAAVLAEPTGYKAPLHLKAQKSEEESSQPEHLRGELVHNLLELLADAADVVPTADSLAHVLLTQDSSNNGATTALDHLVKIVGEIASTDSPRSVLALPRAGLFQPGLRLLVNLARPESSVDQAILNYLRGQNNLILKLVAHKFFQDTTLQKEEFREVATRSIQGLLLQLLALELANQARLKSSEGILPLLTALLYLAEPDNGRDQQDGSTNGKENRNNGSEWILLLLNP